MDGDVGEWELLVVGLLAVAGVEVIWVVMMAGDCWAGRLGNSGGGHVVVVVGIERIMVDVWGWGQLSGGRGVGDVGKCCWCHRWCRLALSMWCRWCWWKLGVVG